MKEYLLVREFMKKVCVDDGKRKYGGYLSLRSVIIISEAEIWVSN